MKKRALFGLALLAGLLMLGSCKDNPHDNTRPPEPFTDTPVKNHRFDGGATDPYTDPGDHSGGTGGGDSGGEAKPAATE